MCQVPWQRGGLSQVVIVKPVFRIRRDALPAFKRFCFCGILILITNSNKIKHHCKCLAYRSKNGWVDCTRLAQIQLNSPLPTLIANRCMNVWFTRRSITVLIQKLVLAVTKREATSSSTNTITYPIGEASFATHL